MASVFIDIPGVGNVEAKNAATEATLKELLKVMQGIQKNTKDIGKDDGKKDGGDDGGSAPGSKAGEALGKLAAKVMPVIGGFAKLGESIISTVDDFAKVGDSVENAAGVFKKIPLLGSLFSAVAGASVKVNDSFLKASSSGASFGGSVSKLAASASAAGMTMDQFGSLVARNGEGMLGFGGTTEEGAKRFAQVSKSLRATSSDLYALGFSTEDINQGLANYGELMRKQGLARGMSDAQLASGAKNYLKEMDALAKITGEERSAKEAQAKALATDAQFQMAMAGKDANVRKDFQNMVLSFGPTLGGFVKDYMATGTLTTEANQKLASMLGGDVMNEMTKLRQKMQNNQRLTDDEQDRLKQIMQKAATANAKMAGTALAADRGMDDASKGLIEAIGLNDNAHKKATAGQENAAKAGDGFNKKMQETQQKLAQFSNAFQMALANSGVLDFMLKMFTVVANIVQTFVVPAFNMLASVISTVGSFLIDVLTPVFQAIGTAISTVVVPVFEYLGGIINEYVVPAFEYVSAFIQDNLTPILYGLGAALVLMNAQAIVRNGVELVGNTLAMARNALMFIANINLAALAGAALAASLPILAFVAPIVAIIALFKYLYDKGWTFGSVFEAIGDNLKRLWISFKEGVFWLLDKITFGDANKAVKQEQAKLEDEKKALDEREKARDASREQTAKERQAEKDKNALARENKKVDAKALDDKKKAAAASADLDKKLNTDQSTEGILKDFAKREGSPLVPKDKQEATKKAESTKKELEAKGEAKTAAEEKAAAARATAEEKAKEESKKDSKPKPTTQESAETLLASLNTKMDQLIKINKGTHEVNEQQLSVQKGLTSDLFAA